MTKFLFCNKYNISYRKYSEDLNTELVRLVEKRLDAKWSSFQMPFEYGSAQTFEDRTNGRHLVFLCTSLVYDLYRYSNNTNTNSNNNSKIDEFFSIFVQMLFNVRFDFCFEVEYETARTFYYQRICQ